MMEEEDENRNVELDKSVPNAKEIYLLMKKEYRISRNIRASWYFKHLNTIMSFVPPTSLSDLSQEELIVLSVIPEEDQVAFQPGQFYNFRLTTKTKVIFMSTQYRIAFALDLSPSLSSLDLCSGRVLWDDVFLALQNCLTGLLQPFCPPGLDLDLAPSLYVTVVAYTPLVACRNNFVLCQGVLVTLKNLKSVLSTLQILLKNFEDNLAQHFHPLADIHMNSYDSDDFILSDGSDLDTMSHRSKSEDQKIEELIYKPEHGFVNVLRFGILALQLLPENATAGIAVVTDGMVGLPDANVFEALLSQLRNSTFACSFLHIGCSHHSNLSFGRVAHTELMKFVAAATFGGYFAAQPDVNTGRELNVYHKAFFLWSFQKGLMGFEVPDTSLHCKQNRISANSSWLEGLPTHPITNQEIPVVPIMRKKHKESNLHTTISGVLSLRLREGYTIREVNLIKGESQIEVHLVLPWREYARIEYIASASWPLSPNKRHTHIEIFIEGNYEFLHEMTCTKKLPSKSPFRTAHIKKYWQSLQNLMQTDQLLVHLHSFSSNPVNYTVPKSLKNGLPLLPSEYSLQQDPSLSDLIKFWNPIASLDINIWQKWMHTHRIGIVLQHDVPLKKYLHTPNSNGYFQSVHCYKAMTALNTMLRQWCTFVLEENHSNLTYMYIKFDDSDPDRAPNTFYILRASSKPPCLVLRLAFLGGTAGDERHAIVSQLREEVLKLQLSQRGPQKNAAGIRASNEKRKPHQQLCLPMSPEPRNVNKKDFRLSSSSTPPRKQLSDVKCCVVLNKPVEKILIRYERVPHDLSIVEDPAREIPRRISSHAEKASRSVAAMFNTMSRYLYHKRWIWSVQQGSWPPMSMSVVGRMLSTIAKIRIQEGFHFALTTIGIVNLVLEIDMKSDNSFGVDSFSGTQEMKDKDTENNNLTEDLTSSTCVVQYILFPPSVKNTRGSVSEDDMEEGELPEADGELQIVTECWVEPQYGISVNNPIERKHLDGLAYKEIASSFYDIDYEAISCLTTFEQLIHLCQCRPDNAYHAQSQQQHQQHRQHLPSCLPGINKFNSTEKCTPDMENCPHLDNNVTTIPFPYNLMGLLPRCQQAEMLFSGYTVNRSIYSGDNWKIPNSVLFEIFLEKLKTSHGQEIWLSSEECQKFTDLLLCRKNEQTMSASSLIADSRPVNEETGLKTETSSKSPGIPVDTPQSENTLDDILFSTETSQSVGPTKWRCFIQDINTSHMFLTFVPASFEDLRTLKPGIHTATLHDNLEIVAVNEWNPSVQKTKPQVYEEIITGPSPVDEKSVLEFVSNPSKSSSSSSRNQENSATDPNQNSSSQQVVTPSLTPHSIPASPGICNASPSFTQQNKPVSPLQPALTPSPLQPTKLPPSSSTRPSLSPLQPCSNLPSSQPNSFPATNGILPSPGLQAEAISPNQPHCVSTSAQSITEASSSNLPPDIENDNSLFQEKEYFILPVYIYDCSLSKIIDSLVHKGAFTLPPDIVEDHTIGDNLFHEYDLGECKSQTPNNLDIHDDSSEGGRHSTASLDRRSNDSISDHPGDFKKHREKVTDVFSSSYVIGIFHNLTEEHYVDKMDIDTAIDICEESPPLEINIVQFLHASCGHLRHVCSKQKKYDEEGATSYYCDDSPRKSAVRFSDRNESYCDSPHLFTEPNISDSKSFQLPSLKVPIPLSPMDEGRTCEYVFELHQIISHKFADTMSTWFKPVPSCPDYYFFCPDPVTVNNNVPGRTGDMSEEQIGTTNESISHSCTTAEDTDIVLDLHGPELNTANKFPLLTTIDPSNSDSDDQSISSSGVESSDADDPCHPLFISFICTLKQNTDHHNIVVGTIPTCLAEITGHLMDKLSELDLGNLQVTFDLYCLTLPLEMDHLPKKFPFIGFADADDDDSSPDGFQKRDPFSFLPKYQHDAIMDCKQEIEWLMRDEIVCALRYVYPIREDKLQMVTEHVQESFQLGKTSCYIEEVTPQFVFGSDQSLSRFLDELQRINIKDYRFKKEGSFFYLVLTRAMAAHFLALSSAVCSLDDNNQTPEKTTKKSTPDDNKGKLAVPQKILSRCISDSCQDWRDSSGKSGLDGREAADVSIQLTNEEGLKEVCPLSPERVAMLNKMDSPCLLTDYDEGVLKRSSSFGGFDAEGCRKVQHHTIASSDKYLSTMARVSVSSTPAVAAAAVVPSGASGMTVKHLTSSPMAHLTCRARHSSAPTAAQKNVTGASSQPSTMPATPSWISSRGSFTEEAGYDGDSSDGDYNNDDGAFFNETGGQRSSMPNFWLVMRVEPKKVTLYYHVRGQKDSSINQRGKQLLKDVSDVIMDTCKKVNQLFLLQDLFTMRMCNVLLVPEADEDICWTKDRYTVPTDGEDEDDDDEQKTYRYLADTRSFLPGHFACKCIWEIHLALHPRLKNWERRTNVSTGMQALRSVLSKLSVNNRKNMFVMKDGLGNYFYVRLDECKISSTSLAEDVTNGRQDFDGYPDCSTISPISTPKRDDDDDEESSKSLRDVDTLSISSMGSYVSKRSEDYIKVSMHGITPAGDEMTEDLRKMLQNKLDDTVLDIISVMLDRNPKCKLNFEDVRFIQRHKEAPKDTIYVTIPNGSLQQLFPLCYYLKQNLLQFVHVPNYVDNHPTKHFIDYASSEPQELKENQVFLYHRPSSSGGKGIACIAMAFVDSRDQEVKFIGCQKPPSLPYDEMVPPEEYPTLIETYLLEELPPHTSKPGLARFIRFRIWERGNVDLPSLKKKLVTSVKHALCDVVSEFQLLTIPICQVSHELLPCYSEPCSPSVVKVAENEEKLYVASRKLSIQMTKMPSKLNTLSKDKTKTPVVTPSPKDVPKFADSLWNISTTTTDGSSGGQQHKISELRNMLLQYESGEKGFLHSVFWTSLPRWFDFCHTLGVPAVNKMELELQARFSVDFLLRELPTQFANITRDINLKVFKLVRESPHGKILTGVPYSPLRNNSSKLGNLDTSFDVDWDNKVSPGKQQQFVVVGRNVEQWSSCVDHYDGRDCPDDSPSSHTSRVSHRELRFSPYLPSGSSTNLENSPTDKYHTLFVPRQHLLLLLINDKTMTFYSYNVAGDMTSGFKKLLRNMVHWQNARAHVLDCVVVQKMGLYHHQPFGESLPIKQQNPFTQSNMDIDMLVMKTYLPKDVTKRNNSMISAGMPYCPQMMGILRPFDEIYRNLKPAQPLHHSPYNNKYDVVLRHGQQAQEIRNNYRKDMDKVLKLRELHSMWFSKNFASISEDIIHLLKQSSRLLHYCATPLLFSPAWRREVLKRVPSKKPEPTPSPVIQEKTDVKVRSRHSSGASIASLLSKRHDSSQEGKKKDRHSQDCTDSPQQRPASLDSPQEEEDWHREIRKKFLQQYMQHLQSLGFVQIQTRPASPKRINGRGNLRKLASEGGRTVRDECDQGKKEVYDMQKTLSGGMILVELNFCDQHYYVKLYGYDCSRMGANVNSQLRLYFVDECDTYRALTHVHSFAHDFHLRCIMNHISGEQDLFRKDYHVTSFLADFLEVYPTPPNFSRNYVHSDYLQLSKLTCPSGQLYDYILKHPNLHDFTVISLLSALTDSELDLLPFDYWTSRKESGSQQDKEEALVLHRQSRTLAGNSDGSCKPNDEYNVGVVVKLDTRSQSGGSICSVGSGTGAGSQVPPSGKDNSTLCLQYFLVLTSKCEIPMQSFVQKLGGTLRATGAFLVPNTVEDFEQFSVPVKQHIGVRSETTNKQRRLSPLHCLVTKEADAAKRKIERTVMFCMGKCRRDILWERLLKGGQEDDGKKKRRNELDDGLSRLTFTDFEELLCMVESSSLSKLDERLLHFTNMGPHWFSTLLAYLPSRYGEQFRYFVNTDGKTQCAVIVNVDCTDTCILLSVNSSTGRADLSLLNREARTAAVLQTPAEDEQHQEAIQNLVETFIGACCFHLWSSMLC